MRANKVESLIAQRETELQEVDRVCDQIKSMFNTLESIQKSASTVCGLLSRKCRLNEEITILRNFQIASI